LFEAGVFMGTLGPERTVLLWPSAHVQLPLPTDRIVYWWLILYGVITFDNVEEWTSGEWKYTDSVEYAVFTERGIALLNELRGETPIKS
jgi:hypothetical protein